MYCDYCLYLISFCMWSGRMLLNVMLPRYIIESCFFVNIYKWILISITENWEMKNTYPIYYHILSGKTNYDPKSISVQIYTQRVCTHPKSKITCWKYIHALQPKSWRHQTRLGPRISWKSLRSSQEWGNILAKIGWDLNNKPQVQCRNELIIKQFLIRQTMQN